VTIVLVCVAVAVVLALVGAWLLISGRREERAEVAEAPPIPRSTPVHDIPPRVRRREAPAQATAEDDPATEGETARVAEPTPAPAPATAAAARVAATRRSPAPTRVASAPPSPASAPGATVPGDVQAAGRARLEAALERARSRLGEDAEPSER